jgi:hypothetical protein
MMAGAERVPFSGSHAKSIWVGDQPISLQPQQQQQQQQQQSIISYRGACIAVSCIYIS